MAENGADSHGMLASMLSVGKLSYDDALDGRRTPTSAEVENTRSVFRARGLTTFEAWRRRSLSLGGRRCLGPPWPPRLDC